MEVQLWCFLAAAPCRYQTETFGLGSQLQILAANLDSSLVGDSKCLSTHSDSTGGPPAKPMPLSVQCTCYSSALTIGVLTFLHPFIVVPSVQNGRLSHTVPPSSFILSYEAPPPTHFCLPLTFWNRFASMGINLPVGSLTSHFTPVFAVSLRLKNPFQSFFGEVRWMLVPSSGQVFVVDIFSGHK